MSLADALIPPAPKVPKIEDAQPEALPDLNDEHIQSDRGGEDIESAQTQDEDMQDLFGEEAVAEDTKHEESPVSPGHSDLDEDALSESERRHREAMEYAEDEEAKPIIEQVLEANAAIPNIPAPRSSDGNHWVLRMPNFVKVDSKPFHPDTYVGPEQEDDEIASDLLREKSMSIKLKVENTVRWRWVKNEQGEDRRQSNARIVRWSDGTLSLKLGKELFDITQTIDTSGAVQRQALGGLSQSQSQTLPPPSTPQKTQGKGLTYLVAQHKRAGILQCEALVTGNMTLRPTGMQSETHRMLVKAVGQKHNRVARLRMAPDPTMDPEREKLELLKVASKKTRKPRGEEDSFGGTRRRRQSYTRKRRSDDVWSDDEEEEVFGAGGSEDEFLGDDRRRRRRADGEEAPARKGPGEYQTDDFLVSDTDEDGDHEDSDHEGRRKRKRTKHRDEGGEEDNLDKLDAKIDQQAAEQRKRRQQVGAKEVTVADAVTAPAVDVTMDVESEEEEEDVTVRRAGTVAGPRKKRAISLDEDEEE